MNKKNQIRISFILALLCVFSFIAINSASAIIYAPLYLKVGLYFGGNVKSSYQLASAKYGIHIFVEVNGKEVELTSTKEALVVYKDNGNNAYHVISDENFTTYEDAFEQYEVLNALGADVFIAYSQSEFWQLWIGSYADYNEAASAAADISGKYPGSYSTVSEPSEKRIIVKTRDTNKIVAASDTTKAPIIARPGGDMKESYLNVESKPYRGSMSFSILKNNELCVINRLILEHYVYGVVALEIGSNSHMEALKAQAVVARTYALCQNKHQDYGFNVCATTDCQVYGGYNAETPQTNQATNETYGQVVTYNGVVVTPYYFSSSGGYTENSENVWVASVPYLKAVVDEYDKDSSWTYSTTKQEIAKALKTRGYDIGDVIKVSIDSSSHTGRVLSLTFVGTKDSATFLKSAARDAFPKSLPSQMFSIGGQSVIKVADASGKVKNQSIDYASVQGIYNTSTISGNLIKVMTPAGVQTITVALESGENTDTIFVSGRGTGHGVGMAQWGAINMAASGKYDYKDIITYFYTGVKLESVTLR